MVRVICFWGWLAVVCGSCGGIRIDDIRSSVSEVRNGNTLVLANGLTVRLIGVRASEEGKNYLKTHVKGKFVSLTVNEEDEPLVGGYDEEVFAYVRTSQGGVNGDLLRKGFADYSSVYCVDSADVFKSYARRECRPVLGDAELFTKCAPAIFTVVVGSGLGSGFFISPDGLAVTNAHVYGMADDEDDIRIYLWDEKGSVEQHRFRKVGRLLEGEHHDQRDWVVFYVQKDRADERFEYLSLAKEMPLRGDAVAILGSPRGDVGNYTLGNVNNILEGEVISVSADIDKGNSGGPIVNKRGEVVGIATWAGFVGEVVTGNNPDGAKRNYGSSILPVRASLNRMGEYYGGKK